MPALLTTVLAAATKNDAGIVVDLRNVDFIEVTAVNALVGARHHLRSTNRDLLIRSPPSPLLRMLTIFGLTDRVEPPNEQREPSSPADAAMSSRSVCGTELPETAETAGLGRP